jgi:hypothetical protein
MTAVSQEETLLIKSRDTFWAALQLDLTVDDELTAAKVDIVSPTFGDNEAQDSGAIMAEVEPKPSLFQPAKGIFVCGRNTLCQVNTQGEGDRPWQTLRKYVQVFYRGFITGSYQQWKNSFL